MVSLIYSFFSGTDYTFTILKSELIECKLTLTGVETKHEGKIEFWQVESPFSNFKENKSENFLLKFGLL